MWTRPSWCTPMSTNAPKLVTFVTMPGQIMPGCRSLSSWMSSRNENGTNVVARIAPGLLQLAHDVVEGEVAELLLQGRAPA